MMMTHKGMHSASRSDTQRARQLRNRMTDAELRLWLRLRCEQMDRFRFRRQIPIGAYIVDFVCFKARLIVEVDGGQHATVIAKDAERTEWLMSQGFRVLRFWNSAVLKELDSVAGEIRKALANHSLPSDKGEGTTASDPLPNPPHKGEGVKSEYRG